MVDPVGEVFVSEAKNFLIEILKRREQEGFIVPHDDDDATVIPGDDKYEYWRLSF
jgi:hypothetical protein